MNLSEKEIYTILKEKLPILSPKDIESFLNITTYHSKKNKEIVLSNNQHFKKVFLILDGTVRGSIIDKRGNERIIMIRSEGIFVADVMKIFADKPQRLTFKAIGNTHILLFNFKDFETLALNNANILLLYLNILKEGTIRLTYRVESLITMTNEERYMDLFRLNPKFLDRVYDKQIANYLGITNVSLSRIIKKINKAKN